VLEIGAPLGDDSRIGAPRLEGHREGHALKIELGVIGEGEKVDTPHEFIRLLVRAR
jgi:hypothetical protein